MDLESKLEDTYKKILKITNYVDSLKVVKKVNEYRHFWKPEKVNVVLLAESHVYTTEEDMQNLRDIPGAICLPKGYPRDYVRFVYCLGYGENDLLARSIKNNRGTYQFWKIFFSCCNRISSNADFKPILKTKTRLLKKRVKNKIELLEKLKENGIWLVDASIVGLYSKSKRFSQKIKREIISLCWNSYTKPLLDSLQPQPKYIICIGIGVGNILESQLRNVGMPFEVIPHPQARLSANEHLENYRRLFQICRKYGEK